MLEFLTSWIGSCFELVQFEWFSIAFWSFLSLWALLFIFNLVWGRS